MRLSRLACAIPLLTYVSAAPPGQVPLKPESGEETGEDDNDSSKTRPFYGRFLHITDFHPDRFYELYSSTEKENACHSGRGPAGVYGAEMSDCDSPIALINKTMDWVGKNMRDKVDFVIWTGDSARHDNDENHPRTADQVLGLNEFMVEKFVETFGKDSKDPDGLDPNNDFVVPIVPSFGNNDILPHNIFTQGPNKWTRAYSKIWKKFIPEEQRHQFEQGGWFYVEVIPRKLAVFSLNTMYFFTSNAAADGCARKSEPGYHQMEWLRIQLQFMRQRGMKAILMGHVPPVRTDVKTSWDETCWQKYTLWLQQYRDVVVSSHYGHFNYDHFILQDFEDLRKGTKKGRMPDYKTSGVDAESDDFHTAVSSNYFIELRDKWAELPEPPKSLKWPRPIGDDDVDLDLVKGDKKDKDKKGKKKKDREDFLDEIGGEYAERYAMAYVAASVVPNLFPSLRVFEYNATGLDASQVDGIIGSSPRLELRNTPPLDDQDFSAPIDEDAEYEAAIDIAKKKKRKKKHKKQKKNKFTVPDGPSKSSPPGPAYSPQTFSLLKYTQYLANLTHINNDFPIHNSEKSDVDISKWREGKHKGKKPHDKDYKPHPKKFGFDVEYETQEDGVYDLTDLTMPRMVDLARRIGGFKSTDVVLEDAEEDREVLEGEEDQEEEEADSDDEYESDDEVGAEKKKKKKHKHKHKKKRRKGNEAWYTFVRRAFVETLTRKEIEEQFG